MATIKTRRRADGTDPFRVVWRAGGTREGAWQSETFDLKREAVRFRRDVDLVGQQWPDGWVKGVGYQLAAPLTAPTERPLLFVEFAQTYVRELTGIRGQAPGLLWACWHLNVTTLVRVASPSEADADERGSTCR